MKDNRVRVIVVFAVLMFFVIGCGRHNNRSVATPPPPQPEASQPSTGEVRRLQEKLGEIEAENARLRNQQPAAQTQPAIQPVPVAPAPEVKAGQAVPVQASSVSAQLPAEGTLEKTEVKNDVTVVKTYGLTKDFVLFRPVNGRLAKYTDTVLELAIGEILQWTTGRSFEKEFRGKIDRYAQEAVVEQYNPGVKSLTAPVKLFEPNEVVLPTGHQPNFRALREVKNFGANPRTRMGPKITNLRDFLRNYPQLFKAFTEPGRANSFIPLNVRAELADRVREVGRTGKVDGKYTREVNAYEYPDLEVSLGSGHPAHNLLFAPDTEGRQEKALQVFSRIAGKWYQFRYICGANLDIPAGQYVQEPVRYSVTRQENYLLCDTIESLTVVPVNGVIQYREGQSLSFRVRAMPTGPDVKEVKEDWVWRFGTKIVGAAGQQQVTFTPEGDGDLMVESRTAGGGVKVCRLSLAKAMPPLPQRTPTCTATVSPSAIRTGDDVIHVRFDIQNPDNFPVEIRRTTNIPDIQLTSDVIDIQRSDIPDFSGVATFKAELLNPETHQLYADCSGMANVHRPSSSGNHGMSRGTKVGIIVGIAALGAGLFFGLHHGGGAAAYVPNKPGLGNVCVVIPGTTTASPGCH